MKTKPNEDLTVCFKKAVTCPWRQTEPKYYQSINQSINLAPDPEGRWLHESLSVPACFALFIVMCTTTSASKPLKSNWAFKNYHIQKRKRKKGSVTVVILNVALHFIKYGHLTGLLVPKFYNIYNVSCYLNEDGLPLDHPACRVRWQEANSNPVISSEFCNSLIHLT